MTIEQALTLIAIFTPLNLYLWFGVGLGTFRLDIEPKIKNIPDPLKTSATGLIYSLQANAITRRATNDRKQITRTSK